LFEVEISRSATAVKSNMVEPRSIIVDKLNVIRKSTDGKLFLNLENTSIELFKFTILNDYLPVVDATASTANLPTCTHEFVDVAHDQLARFDEAFNAFLQCQKCDKWLIK
jgi:hypothetical protein